MYITSMISVVVLVSGMQAFDPETGELSQSANCEQYHTGIDELKEKMDANPETEQSAEVLKQQGEAVEKGCPPSPNWGVMAGVKSTAIDATYHKHQFVPASSAESGVPMNYDFLGNLLNSVIGLLTGGTGEIFPKIKETVTTVTTTTGGSGSGTNTSSGTTAN